MTATEPPWTWLDAPVLCALHDEQLCEHGGTPGVRDAELLVSVLARPLQLARSGAADVADLASAYAHGIAVSRPFIDGNARTAFVALALFLALQGLRLGADDGACVLALLALSAGHLDEATFAAWLRPHLVRRDG